MYEAKLGRHANAATHIGEAVRLGGADGDVVYRKAVVHALASTQ